MIGSTQKTLTPFAPVPIEVLAQNLPVASPDEVANQILEKNTVYPLLKPALTAKEAQALKNRLLNGDLQAKLSQFTKDDHTIKFCPQCARSDGPRFLRRKQQLRGYTACLDHGTRLVEVPISEVPTMFYGDLQEIFSQVPSKPVESREIELEISRRLESFSDDFRDISLEAILDDVSSRYRSYHSTYGKQEEFFSYYRDVSGETGTFSLDPFFSVETCTKRINLRLFRIVALQQYCDSLAGTAPKPRLRASASRATPSVIPRALPSGTFPCKNPVCEFHGDRKASVIAQGLNTRKWVIKCPHCGFAYEATISGVKVKSIALHTAGPRLAGMVAQLWNENSWNTIKRKTNLKDRLLILVAQELGLPLDSKSANASRWAKTATRMSARKSAALEKNKEILLEFFASHPAATISDLKKSAVLYVRYRQLRFHEPAWIFAHCPKHFLSFLPKRRSRYWQAQMDVE